ncbi:MAG: hypothetical protein LBF97_01760, partial [Elusimicrobiota bacterium]|nr:hypothetical protein [Elusimicrobiota bacterium]
KIIPSKSTFDVKFTSAPVKTSSIYTIQTNIDVIPIDIVQLNTIDLLTNLSNNFSSTANLIFTIDEQLKEFPFTVNLSSCSSSSDVYNVIIGSIAAKEEDIMYGPYVINRNSIVKKSFKSRNSLIFGNVEKKNTSNITFYYDEEPGADNVKLYYTLFGTNLTNPDFYNLYTKDMFFEDDVDDVSNVREWSNGMSVPYFDGYIYVPTQDHPLVFKYRQLIEKVVNGQVVKTTREADYYIDVVETQDFSNQKWIPQFYLKKTENSTFQDFPFYIHFVNNRDYEVDKDGNKSNVLDEDLIQEYLNKYKISGMDLTLIPPYFKPFELQAEIEYNRSYSYVEIKQTVERKLTQNYSIYSTKIGQRITRSKIFKDIMTVAGVENCSISYFGFDLSGRTNNVEELNCDFYEILCKKEDSYDSYGNQIGGFVLNYVGME